MNLLDRAFSRVTDWQLANERRGVTGGTALRLFARLTVICVAIPLAVLSHGWISGVAFAVLAGSAGAGITSGIVRCHAWRRGYMAAQREVIDRAVKAADEGLLFDTWAQQEALHSLQMLR